MSELVNFIASGFRFESPWFLLFLVLLPLLVYLCIVRKKPSIRIPWIKPYAEVSPRKKYLFNSYTGLIFYSLAYIFIVIALARPQYGVEEVIQRADGIDMMLLMDISGSMQLYDIPKNLNSQIVKRKLESGEIKPRIDYSKEQITNFVRKRPNDRIGLVVFAPKAYIASPPTLDHTFLISHIDKAEASLVGDSTNIAAPIIAGVNSLKDAPSKRKVMVLFTDGANNVNDRISPLQAAQLAKTFNITIYSVGIGSPLSYLRQNTMFGSQLVPIQDHFDEKLMKEIASITGGRFFMADDEEALKAVLDEIDKLEKTSLESPKFIDYSEYGPRLAIFAIILLAAGLIFETLIFPKYP